MPIYEYECEECHKVSEVWQSLSEEQKTTCPECSGPLKKLISMSSFQLKGGGWYADGYHSNGKESSCKAAGACSAAKEDTKGAASCPKAAGAPCCA